MVIDAGNTASMIVAANETYTFVDRGETVVEAWTYSSERADGAWHCVDTELVEWCPKCGGHELFPACATRLLPGP